MESGKLTSLGGWGMASFFCCNIYILNRKYNADFFIEDLLLALVPLSAVRPCPRDFRLLTLVLPLALRKEDWGEGGGIPVVKTVFHT